MIQVWSRRLLVACLVLAPASSLAVACSAEPEVAHERSVQSALDAPPTFTDVTAASGISGGEGSWAGSWADVDGDDDLDVFTTAHLQNLLLGENKLWLNDGDGTFTDGTLDVGIDSDKIDTHSAIWGDFDKDADLDLVLVNETLTVKPELYHEFWRNDGDTFTEIAEEAGVLGYDHITRGAAAMDFNRDGWLDLMMVVWESPTEPPGEPRPEKDKQNMLFQNDGDLDEDGVGDLTFTDVGVAAGIALPDGQKRTVTWGDYDDDGWPDLIVNPPCQLYHNNGDGTFSDANEAAGVSLTDQCQAAAFFDYDDDGDLDLYSSRGFNTPTQDVFYQNQGDGTFTDVTVSAGIDNPQRTRAVNSGDYDNDGDQDLYVVSLDVDTDPNQLYQNQGDGTFSEVAASAGVTAQVEGAGSDASFVDYDSDGDLDLFVTNGEGNATGLYLLLQNGGTDNNWVKLKLVGTVSNAEAIGARVTIETALKSQHYLYSGQEHFMAANLVPLHVGLGDETAVERVVVTWPNGLREEFTSITIEARNTLIEGTGVTLPTDGAGGAGAAGGSGGEAATQGGAGGAGAGDGVGGAQGEAGASENGGTDGASAGNSSTGGSPEEGGADGGSEPAAETDEGCGCSVPGAHARDGSLAMLAIALAGFWRRRRSRQPASAAASE
jgi:enediyne biosynthesis protein E4